MVCLIENVEDFEAKLKQAGDKLVVLDFFAEWCPPCNKIGPKFVELSKKYTNVIFYKVDVDDAADVAEKCSVESMPTFIFFKNGQQVDKVVGGGEETENKLETIIKKLS
ncbi:thioredoxin-like [Scyliorhinus canicula]|uniref:thioredoxin-like n=1 Tax=Scyliorhinus canicula TaxID=7830 RepID=UPI0018F41921|nr:thioredoxin-like [Scyliorhinus canicula]